VRAVITDRIWVSVRVSTSKRQSRDGWREVDLVDLYSVTPDVLAAHVLTEVTAAAKIGCPGAVPVDTPHECRDVLGERFPRRLPGQSLDEYADAWQDADADGAEARGRALLVWLGVDRLLAERDELRKSLSDIARAEQTEVERC